MAAIFGEIKILRKMCSLIYGNTLRIKNFIEIAVSRSYRDTGIFVFSSFGKFVMINHELLGHFLTNQCQNLLISRF